MWNVKICSAADVLYEISFHKHIITLSYTTTTTTTTTTKERKRKITAMKFEAGLCFLKLVIL